MNEMKNTFPLVSVIILNYNGLPFVEDCLKSVLETNYPNLEVIFVDNGSTDGSYEHVQSKFGKDLRLKIVRNHKNYGYCKGNNIGFKYAKGKYIAFLNNDVEVTRAWLLRLISEIKRDPTIGIAHPKVIKRENNKLTIDCVGGFLHPLGFAFAPRRGETDKGQCDKTREVLAAPGAAFIIRREIIDRVGLFDEDYFMLSEEIDLSLRVWLSGYKIVVVPASIVCHEVSATMNKMFEPTTIFYLSVRNYIVTLLKNLELKNLVRTLPPYIAVMILYSLKKRNAKQLLCILTPLLWMLRNIRTIIKKRCWVQNHLRTVKDSQFLRRFCL